MAKRRLLLLGVGLALAGSAQAQGQKPLGVLYSGDASVRGAVLLRAQATEVLSGSQVAAGQGSAVLKLERGGQLRICPQTNLSLNAGASGKSLSLGLNAGAMELDYTLDSGADSLITPDFRLLLISPGSFHLAISVAGSGDTCMRSLPGNTASVFVTEMMGSDSYQLAPGKNVLFLKGKISAATQAPEVCGCPETTPPPQTEFAQAAPSQSPAELPAAATRAQTHEERASATLPPQEQPAAEQPPAQSSAAAAQQPSAAQVNPAGNPAAAKEQPDAAAATPEVSHLEVDSRFSYRGDAEMQDFYSTASRLSITTDNSRLALALLPQIKQPGEKVPASQQSDAAGVPSALAPHSGGASQASSPEAPPNSKVTVAESGSGGGFRRFFRRLFGGH